MRALAALRPTSIRKSLVALVVACLLPLIALAAVLMQQQTASYRTEVEAQLLAQSRALSLAIERELGTARTALTVLARAKELEERDFEEFHQLAAQVANGLGGAAAIVLVEGDRVLVNTAERFGPPQSALGGPALEAARTTLPVVSNLYVGPRSRLLLVGIGIPVRTPGGFFGLAVSLPPDRFSAILRAQGLPAGWQSGVVDGAGLVIGRSNERQRAVGERANDGLIAAREASREGLFRTTSRRGEAMLGAFASIPGSDWLVRVTLLDDQVAAGRRGSLGWLALGAFVCLGASLVGAALMAERIVRPIRALENAATSVGGDALVVPGAAATLAETARVATTLAAAQATLREADQSRAAAARAEAARLRAEDASKAKSEFLAHISHEVRTPLSGVIGMTDVLLLEPLPPSAEARVRILRSTATSLGRMLDDLLDFAKIEARKVVIEQVPFDPASLASEVAELFRPAAAAQGVSLAVAVAADVPGTVTGDPVRLREVLSNVVGNAVKFTPSGRIDLAVTATDAGRRLVMRVTDTGIGVDDAALERIFEPFTQASPETAGRYGGTGLGLAISRRLVEAMGGTITARHAAPRGTVFEFDVRVGPVPPGTVATPPATAPAGGEPPGLRPLRVLVVEDNAVIRDTEAAMLARMGHVVTSAANGRLALDALAHGAFDIVLMDLRMPELDGRQTLARMRETPHTRDLPVIAVSAAIEELGAAPDGPRFDAMFAKPVDWDQLAAAMARLTAGRAPAVPPQPAVASINAAAFAMQRPLSDLLDAFRALLAEGEAQLAAGDEAAVRETVHTIAGIAGIFGCDAVVAAVRESRGAPSTERFGRVAAAVRRTVADLEANPAVRA